MATGLLTIGVGPATRLLTYMVGLNKTYEATIRLGATTVTDDHEGEIVKISPNETLAKITDEDIYAEIKKLSGDILQIPSSVSAVRIQGKKAYELVREGQKVELKPRAVTVFNFNVDKISRVHSDENNSLVTTGDYPETLDSLAVPDSLVIPDSRDINFIDINVSVTCSSGTYIRALARDLGEALKVGGHLTRLRRTSVGPFELKKLNYVSTFAEETAGETTLEPNITPPQEVAKELFDTVTLTESQSVELLQGKRFEVEARDTDLVAALSPTGALLGLVKVKNGVIRAITNFPQN